MLAALTYLPISSGGLGMVDLLSFNRALKVAWLFKALHNPTAHYSLQLQQCLPVSIQAFLTFNLKKTHLHWFCTKPLLLFWEHVLQYWCEAHFTCTKNHVGLLPIAYNSALTIKRSSKLFNAQSIAEYEAIGIYSVSDFIE